MDARNSRSPRSPGVVASRKLFAVADSARPPLITTEKNNAGLANGKARTREVTSRYKAGITGALHSRESARSPSPNANRTATRTPLSKRAQSVEKGRPSTPSARPSTPPVPSARPSTPLVPSFRSPSPSARPSTPSALSSRHLSPSSKPSVTAAPSSRAASPSSRLSMLSSPSSRKSVSSSPSSRPSSPSSQSSRSSTPVRDSVVDVQNSSRRSSGSRDGLWPSMRNLSSSFQSDSSFLTAKRDRSVRLHSPDPVLKPAANAASEGKRSPLRGRNISDQSVNSKPVENSRSKMIDQHRWPSIGKMPAHAFSRSMDLTDKIRNSSSSSILTRGVSPTRRKTLFDSVGSSLQKSINEAARHLSSDGSKILGKSADANLSSHPSERPPSLARASRTQSLPVPSFHHPSSPSKALAVSASRGMQSPSRTRPSTPVSPSRNPTSQVGASSSPFNYIVNVRTGRKNENHLEDAHLLRLLYNRTLQWRFINAHADAVFVTQKITSENALYNLGNVTSELHDSVSMKRINLQKMKQEMALNHILNEQIAFLEDWSALEKEHSSCLSGATEALKASTLRLPVTGGARADVRAVKNTISSAVDVMQTMGSSICYLLSLAESTNSVVSELSNVAAKERAMLNECRELLASTASMKVQECSLQAHLLQLKHGVA